MERLQLVYGNNTMRVTEVAKELARSFLKEPDEFSLVTLNYRETSIETIMEEAQTLPLLSDRKAVIVNDAFSFTGARVKAEVTHDIDRLADYLTNKNDDALVIFKVFSEQLDKRKRITKIMKQRGNITEVGEMNEQEIRDYLQKTVNDNGVSMDRPAMDAFIHRTGIDYETVTNEINKLMLFADDSIVKADVESVVSISLEQNIFKLTDLILKNQKADAVNLLRDLLLQKEEPMQLLHLIIGQFRLLYQVKLMLGEGYQQDYIAKSLKVHPYRVKLASKDVRKYDQAVLEGKMVMCRNMDYRFKSSYLDRQTLFELFVLEI
ncbi:DNA polymerase III subunit delta [Salinicoccus albus]|uniref:DNA polymerase III subunit delta n=1 Tax=Salinicoccus albus TaxID=418756 RepID=UPI00036B38DA|nr:DNA polymerase III subunit delta [Salinicoccus albus]